ncbi:hypothetical protein ACFQFH_08555 [Halobaculum halobium]|uniref:Uncharacterized protein n=1 Tax=Halobaculum halobium TaxID=3032281 RepID=A0ABD5T992_9EURY|nr:hypothetical protein [Halobaculum sp. SYNS20]
MTDGTDDTGQEPSTDADEPTPAEAASAFIASADDVYDDYDRGYVDADAALAVLSSRIDDLRDAVDSAAAAENGDEP